MTGDSVTLAGSETETREASGCPARSERAREMAKAKLPADHPKVKTGRIGVLLVNLGTPDGTDFRNMRKYLRQFLMSLLRRCPT